MRTKVRYGLAIVILVFFAVCCSWHENKVVKMEVNVKTPCAGVNPLDSCGEDFTITVEASDKCDETDPLVTCDDLVKCGVPADECNADLHTGPSSTNFSKGAQGQLKDIPVGNQRVVTVSCFNGDALTARGVGQPVDVLTADADKDNPITVNVLVASVDSFTLVTDLQQDNTCAGVPDWAGEIGHTATVLNDGRVLITGGAHLLSNGALVPSDQAYLFDPNTGEFQPTAGKMTFKRYYHTATLLNTQDKDNLVLITGGLSEINKQIESIKTAELFDPTTGSFQLVGSGPSQGLSEARAMHAAVLLKDNRVMISGGYAVSQSKFSEAKYLKTAEVFDPGSSQFVAVPSMSFERAGHTATLLKGGQVLIVGGREAVATRSEIEVYKHNQQNPAQSAFLDTGKRLKNARFAHAAVLDKNSNVIITGGISKIEAREEENYKNILSSVERYVISVPPLGDLQTPCKEMSIGRAYHTMNVVPTGRIIIAGGQDNNGMAIGTAEEISDLTCGGTTTKTNGDLNQPRYMQSSVTLKTGQILLLGGRDQTTTVPSAEIFNFNPNL